MTHYDVRRVIGKNYLQYQVQWDVGGTSFIELDHLFCGNLIVKYECEQSTGSKRDIFKCYAITEDNKIFATW